MNFTKVTILKIVEMVLVVVLMGLHYNSWYGSKMEVLSSTGAITGYLIILAGALIGLLTDTPINRRVDLFFSIVGCIIFIISGSLVLDNKSGMGDDKSTAKGSLCIIEGIIFAVDAALVFKGES